MWLNWRNLIFFVLDFFFNIPSAKILLNRKMLNSNTRKTCKNHTFPCPCLHFIMSRSWTPVVSFLISICSGLNSPTFPLHLIELIMWNHHNNANPEVSLIAISLHNWVFCTCDTFDVYFRKQEFYIVKFLHFAEF